MKEEQERTPLRAILQNFLNHIEKLDSEEVEGSYDKEFQELKLFSEILKSSKQFSCSQGEKEVNRKKNRYKDILPFDESRVILDGYAGVPGSDYINANYIKGASGSPAYIASQAPLPHTVNDFWRMVVQCEVQVIVMACNEEEAGKHKCENYWVEREGEERQFGMVAIRLIKASIVCPDFLVRTMRLKYTNSQSSIEERTVCQFHYSAWPDHGVPPLVRPLLDMVRLVRDTQASETLPVLVHCSAGCGRTGTICAIDYVWGLLRAGKLTKDFSLFKLVRDMRRQRIAMVQTKEQYILVHHAVKELFCEQLRMIDSHPYENIDVNGMPLVKDVAEPMYVTVAPEKCSEEKQDNREKENDLSEKADLSPLPSKKKPHTASSKHEKEVENLTEKQRSIVEQSSNCDQAVGLLQKPRIAKLKALFERVPANRENRNINVKHRTPQQVTRSHSLGAVRKTENVVQPIPCKGILRVPQLSSIPLAQSIRPAVPIKRSKSLKVLGSGECYKLSVASCVDSSSPRDAAVIVKSENGNPKRLDTVPVNDTLSIRDRYPSDSKPCIPPKKLLKDKVKDRKVVSDFSDVKYLSKVPTERSQFPRTITEDALIFMNNSGGVHRRRRRSLESFTSDDLSFMAPPNAGNRVEVIADHVYGTNCAYSLHHTCDNYQHVSERSVGPLVERRVGCPQFDGVTDRTDLQQQKVSVEAQMRINAGIAGIGIRERRNSFRQAINTSKDRVIGSSSNNESALQVGSINTSQLVTSGGQKISSENSQSKGSSLLNSSVSPYSFGAQCQLSFRGSEKKLQHFRHDVDLVRAKSDKCYMKGISSVSTSVGMKGAKVVDHPKETEHTSSTPAIVDRHTHCIKENRNLISSVKHSGTVTHPQSKVSLWPITVNNFRTAVASTSTFSSLPEPSELSREYNNSKRCMSASSRSKKAVDVPVNGKIISGTVPVHRPNLVIKEPDVAVSRKLEYSERTRIPSDITISSGPVHVEAREASSITQQPIPIHCSIQSSLSGSLPDKKIRSVEMSGSSSGAYKLPASVSQLKTPSGRGLEETKKKQDQNDGGVLSFIQRRDDVRSSRAPVAPVKTPGSTETDVVSYGLVAGVQLRQGSRDDLALCGSGPTAPPRVRRHASVVLLRHSLIETSDSVPVAPLTIWNSTQQGGEIIDKGPTNQQLSVSTWSGASGVDLDTIAANIKFQAGEQSTTVMRTLEALHLRKSSPRSGSVASPEQSDFQHVQSRPLKKQHYL